MNKQKIKTGSRLPNFYRKTEKALLWQQWERFIKALDEGELQRIRRHTIAIEKEMFGGRTIYSNNSNRYEQSKRY
jgi:hypothetical protein